MDRAEILARIKKCLALAASANEHEAAAALAKARALMDEHGVDQAEIAAADVGEARVKGGGAWTPPHEGACDPDYQGRPTVKLGGGKDWFTASELADLALSGLPSAKRKINERAGAEAWALRTDRDGAPLARPRQARGGGLEYHVDVLPASARAAIAALGVAAIADVHAEPTTGAA